MRRPESPNRNKGLIWVFVALVGILARAVFLGVYRLDQVPPGIHADEVINGEPLWRAAYRIRLRPQPGQLRLPPVEYGPHGDQLWPVRLDQIRFLLAARRILGKRWTRRAASHLVWVEIK